MLRRVCFTWYRIIISQFGYHAPIEQLSNGHLRLNDCWDSYFLSGMVVKKENKVEKRISLRDSNDSISSANNEHENTSSSEDKECEKKHSTFISPTPISPTPIPPISPTPPMPKKLKIRSLNAGPSLTQNLDIFIMLDKYLLFSLDLGNATTRDLEIILSQCPSLTKLTIHGRHYDNPLGHITHEEDVIQCSTPPSLITLEIPFAFLSNFIHVFPHMPKLSHLTLFRRWYTVDLTKIQNSLRLLASSLTSLTLGMSDVYATNASDFTGYLPNLLNLNEFPYLTEVKGFYLNELFTGTSDPGQIPRAELTRWMKLKSEFPHLRHLYPSRDYWLLITSCRINSRDYQEIKSHQTGHAIQEFNPIEYFQTLLNAVMTLQ